MALSDGLQVLLGKLEHPAVRGFLLCVGVVVLLRLRLMLFAAALPLMVYWVYSNQTEDEPETKDVLGERRRDEDGVGSVRKRKEQVDLNMDADSEEGMPWGHQPFWSHDKAAERLGRTSKERDMRNNSSTNAGKESADFGDNFGLDDHDEFGLGSFGKKTTMEDIFGGHDDLDDNFGSTFGLGLDGGKLSLGESHDPFDDFGGFGKDDDLDFRSDNVDTFAGSGRGRGKSKGKSKGDRFGFEKGGSFNTGTKAPSPPDPKQVFVAGVGDMPEDGIKSFFEDIGEVDRVKVLRQPDGQSKGVCFVTFRSEEQAQKALNLHGAELGGKPITVRFAHGGKGAGKGNNSLPTLDFGGSERFGVGKGGGSRGKGAGLGAKRSDRSEIDELLEEALADSEGPLKAGDFDFAARRFLTELKSRDRAEGTELFHEALEMVFRYTSSKDRTSVRKWPAYIFKLLQKFDPRLWEELRERDAERRREKAPLDDEVFRARRVAQTPSDGKQAQVHDRWGKQVLM